MSYRITYQVRAIIEYEMTTEWYRLRSVQAAENFKRAVQEKVDLLKDNPKQYKNTYGQFHEVALKKYPYNIVYLINEEDKLVAISSIYHHKRNPKRKFKSF